MNRIRIALVTSLALLASACGPDKTSSPAGASGTDGAAKQLNLLTWSGYLDPEIVKAFEAEFHCTVVEANFESNEELRAKLQIANAGYDLVCPSDYTVTQLVGDGLLLEIDHAHIPNLKNLGGDFAKPAYDPELKHSVPFQWGVTGIGFDKTKIAAAPASWADLFHPAKLAGGKATLGFLDDGREVLGAALLSLGFSPNSHDAKQITTARDRVVAMKAAIANFDSSDFGSTLAQGQTTAAHGWSGTFAIAQRDNANIAFVVPKEGAFRYVDNWAIPKGAKEKPLAESFIDYLLRPDVAAKLVALKLYASPNEAAKKLIDPAILKGMSYSDGGGAKLWWVEVLPDDVAKLYADAWAAIKSE